jgi:hypothetical protein
LKTLAALDARAEAEMPDPLAPLHDPPLRPRDEAVFLLTAVAEIEHALMVQYLFAAYSIKVPDDPDNDLQRLQDRLVQIAREEMGHLVTVQNLLHLVGGPLNLGRDRAPYGSEIYPFRFTLEPVTRLSLAKYVTAESPAEKPSPMTEDEWNGLVKTLAEDAEAANGGPIHHVGALYQRLEVLFGDGPEGMADADFRTDTAGRQATWEDWGYDPLKKDDPQDRTGDARLIVVPFTAPDVATLRGDALNALKAIADQGEGFDPGTPGESHFERFLDVYKIVDGLLHQNVEVTWPIATDPNTSTKPVPAPTDALGLAAEAIAAAGRITDERARAWAQLFNLRYRMLLGRLIHFLRLDGDCYVRETAPPQDPDADGSLGDRTARGLLLIGAFDEMRHLKKIAAKLVRMPKDAGGVVNAGPPFELPYSLSLPDGEAARWRMHLDVSRAVVDLMGVPALANDADPLLAALKERDCKAQEAMAALAAGEAIPATSLPTGFTKVVSILDEAVRGFHIRKHGNFWSDQDRFQFIHTTAPGPTPVAFDPNGEVLRDPAKAQLIKMITLENPSRRMPKFRPPVPDERVEYLRRWVKRGAPDGEPAGQKVTTEPEPDLAAAPAGPGPVVDPPASVPGFAADIAPLFRPDDRDAMLDRFDLASVEDVRANAADILDAVDTQFMPCDGPWPPERVELFRRWVDGGMPS